MKRSWLFHSNKVWPPLGWVLLAVILLGCLEGVMALAGFGEEAVEASMFRVLPPGLVALVYAIYRLRRFHPAFNRAYADWLRLSPWCAGNPLPLGPVHLVWQDAVVVGVLVALSRWYAGFDPLVPLFVFTLAYLAGMTLSLLLTRRIASSLAMGYLWPALAVPVFAGAPRWCLVGSMMAVVWDGHRRSMRAFPWEHIFQPKTKLGRLAGWPFAVLSPKFEGYAVSMPAGIICSVLLGWWWWCAAMILGSEPSPGMVIFVSSVAALGRWGLYCSGLASPFGLAGRIKARRFVLPGFDRVLLAPAIAVGLAIAGGVAIRHSGVWHPVTEAVVISLVMATLLLGGPTMRNWVLTGYHRWTVPMQDERSKLRKV